MGDAHIVIIYVREGEFPEPYTAGEPLIDDYLSKALALSGLLLLRKRNQLGPIVLGILTLRKSHSTGGMVFGVYLLLIGVNYVPMLIQAISLVKNGTARDEIADELEDKQRLFRKYRKQSL